MFWKRERRNFKNDLAYLRNDIYKAIRQCQSDWSTDPKNAPAYECMISACYEALKALQEENISGVMGANTALNFGKVAGFNHLHYVIYCSRRMENDYYDDYYEDYRYRK